jgi:hypothetical protein
MRPFEVSRVVGAVPPKNKIEDPNGGKVKAKIQSGVAAASMALMCLIVAACGSGVSGHTYADSDGTVKIAFQSGGKAITTMGPMTATCTYTQSSSTVTLTCADQSTQLTVASDGSLNGPPDGMMNKLTKVN